VIYPVKMPVFGPPYNCKIVAILCSVGDSVKIDQPLFTFECEKTYDDIYSPVSGVVVSIHAQINQPVDCATHVADIETSDTLSGYI
jgi:pyruvate/2-oxoglutarate dehydrogenase complex dihydrolipoamide acyltransferase (E2) component